MGATESRTLYIVWFWTQVLIVLPRWGWAQPVYQKDMGYCAKHNLSPLARSSDWGITIQESCSRHALGEGERLRREGALPTEMCDRRERHRKNLRRYPKAGYPYLLFFFFFFTVSCVVSARVFTLAHCDNLVICLSPQNAMYFWTLTTYYYFLYISSGQ